MTDRPHDRPENLHPAEQPTRDRSPDDERVWVPWSEIELPDEPEPTDQPGESDVPEPTGWGAPELADNPDRPDPRDIHLPDERRTHILDGDPNGPGGGHRAGTGRPGKTEYPADWPDERIIANVNDIAHSPDVPPTQQRDRRWRCSGTRDGVAIVVIVWPEGKIWSAYPEPGSPGVVRNPRPEEQ